MASSSATLSPAKVIVAIDFGTTYSGFSYAHAQSAQDDPEHTLETVEGFDQWPSQAAAGARPYFKTQTSLLYMQKSSSSRSEYELKGWGWSAYCEYTKLLPKSGKSNRVDGKQFHFITKFKLVLAGPTSYGESYKLPEGLTQERVISDYLRELSSVVEDELKNKYGKHISKKDIQWCLTVPAIWGDVAKQQMKKCAEKGGLVSGPSNTHGEASPHPIIIVLEPEAASAYCLHYLKKTHKTFLPARGKILIVDAGGGTVDLVLHEKVNAEADCNQVKEICSGSSGALCGSTYVDAAFYRLLSRKIPCYDLFISEYPEAQFQIRRVWEDFKVCFDGEVDFKFWTPGQMSKYWKDYDKKNRRHRPDFEYDDVQITAEEMRTVFDSAAVDKILKLIKEQLAQVAIKDVDALLVVGGFSGSPYLMDRIRGKFELKVKHIINPTQSGKAVVTGAVAYGFLGKDIVTARISQKTYGIAVWNGRKKSGVCRDCKFKVFVSNSDEVPVNYCRTLNFFPAEWNRGEGSMSIEVYSTKATKPKLVTDRGCAKESSYSFPYPDMTVIPSIDVSMFFGRTLLEVTAIPKNFQSGKVMLPTITFDGGSASDLSQQLKGVKLA